MANKCLQDSWNVFSNSQKYIIPDSSSPVNRTLLQMFIYIISFNHYNYQMRVGITVSNFQAKLRGKLNNLPNILEKSKE